MSVFISIKEHVFELEEAKEIYKGLKEIFERKEVTDSDEENDQLLLDMEFSSVNIES